MSGIAQALIAIVALQHVGFLVLEMFLWKTEIGRQIFRTRPDFAEASAPIAANQGLYNGFLAAGLFWSMLASEASRSIAIFFLSCVIIAGIFGALTANKKIFAVQSVPAIGAMLALFLA